MNESYLTLHHSWSSCPRLLCHFRTYKHVDMLHAWFGIIRLVENIYARLRTLFIAFHISFAIVADFLSLDEMVRRCLSSCVVV